MFAASPTGVPNSNSTLNIGRLNGDAVERVLMELRIPILARDLGGGAGRHLTLDTDSGIVSVRVPGGASYEI
jgi:chemotaxis protein CheD